MVRPIPKGCPSGHVFGLWAVAVIPGAVLFLRFGWLPEVLRLKGMGFSNRDIGEDLGVSVGLVSKYVNISK